MYANSLQTGNAIRTFTPTLVGNTFSLQLQDGTINSGGAAGLSLWNSSNNSVFELYGNGSNGDFTITDSSGAVDTHISATNTAIQADLTLTSPTTYSLSIKNLSNNAVTTFTGTLANPSGGQSITQLRFFDFNASGNDSFFNNNKCSPSHIYRQFRQLEHEWQLVE